MKRVLAKLEHKEWKAVIQDITKKDNIVQQCEFDTKRECKKINGFFCNPNIPTWQNMENILGNMPAYIYFNRPQRMAFHNLCTKKIPPAGIGATLGLDLKFCIQLEKAPNQVPDSMSRFRDDVRKRFFFAGENGLDNKVAKQIYVKSKWIPPEAEPQLEYRMNLFEEKLNREINFLRNVSRKASNLTKVQKNHINLLRDNEEFIILAADKNLGPAIIEREEYIKLILNEHLRSDNTYTHLDATEAINIINSIKDDAWDLIKERGEDIDKGESRYFRFSLLGENHRIPQFYGTPKVHKNKSPVPFRPVVSQCGSISAILSTYIDYKLQPLIKHIPSYVKNSSDLLDQLDKINHLPTTAKLFTSDATSMYTNIDPDEGIPILRRYLEEFSCELDKEKGEDIDIDLICDLTDIVMRRNIFQFGNTFWKQNIGTAMGTPCACVYAIIFFAYFERTRINNKYNNNLLLYRRQIDDIFAIWVSDEHQTFDNFKHDINNYSKLKWNTEDLSDKVDFLDLTIWIDKETNTIQYKTYQKPMSLFLYIPSHSAHPPGVLKSIAYGLISTYKRQNSKEEDFIKQVQLLFNRLTTRGYKHDDLRRLFIDVANKLDNKEQQPKEQIQTVPTSTSNHNQLFFHTEYHPKSFSRAFIQRTYEETCNNRDIFGDIFSSAKNDEKGGTMAISKLTVAYSRPKNLRNLLSPTKLREFDSCRVEQYL